MNPKWYPGYYLDPQHWREWLPEVFPHWLPAAMVRTPPQIPPEPKPEPSSKPSYGLLDDLPERLRPKSFAERLAEITRAGLLPVPAPSAPQPNSALWGGLLPLLPQPTQWPDVVASLPASVSAQSLPPVLSRWPNSVMTTAGVPAKIAGWSWDLLDNVPVSPVQWPNAPRSLPSTAPMPPAGTRSASAATPNVLSQPTDQDPEIMSDETPDNLWIPGAQYAADGQHWFSQEHWKGIPRDALKVFDQAGLGKTGRLPLQLRPDVAAKFGQPPVMHWYDEAHRQYNKGVGDLYAQYLKDKQITPGQMTPTHAHEVLRAIAASEDPRIQFYRQFIFRFFRMHRLRSGIRAGSE